jgi:hypothetical protein
MCIFRIWRKMLYLKQTPCGAHPLAGEPATLAIHFPNLSINFVQNSVCCELREHVRTAS